MLSGYAVRATGKPEERNKPMPSFNKVICCGNLTRDPELRYTPKGMAIARISIAMNRKWKSELGEMKEEVTYVECDAFGKTAETIGQYLTKGRPILIEGRLKLDQWEDKQTNQKRSKLGVVIESFQFMGEGKGKSESPREATPKQGDLPVEEDPPF
jgi:single-strand DNA-binding protein